jgi:hypothetical protein
MRLLIVALMASGIGLVGGDSVVTRSNKLTANEATDGWLLLFDGDSTFGWSASKGDKLSVKEGVLRFEGAGKLANTTAFSEFALEFQCRVSAAKNHDDVQITFPGKTVGMALPKVKNPTWAKAKLIVASNRYKFTLTSERGDFPSVSGDLAEAEPTPITFTVTDGVTLELRDVTLVPVQMKAIFTGKNLDGWKVFPGKKSKFTVNDKLELNIKDGPGDLQTEAQFGDFLLQLQCFSNGKHLNSGVFFRCRDNEYQNGYEAQIHNGFTLDPPKDYTVDDYDPQTHKLTGKHKVKSAANDWGTGAIYRRVPARQAVAKDFEWFTLTLLAHGNHYATWVNGIQVVDWTDHRPADSNPRNGCRLEPGHISLQGHDPTTDLSFRNIRISEYPALKKKS